MEKKIKKLDNVKWRKDFEFITIYNYNTDDLFKASKITGEILELSDGTRSIDEVIDELINNSKVEILDSTREKLEKYIKSLIEKEVIAYIE
ncbi:MAG: hypothetical protein KH549_05455 [Clostridium sp.]|nr:hypothetical protein [Clostridium sp.]